MPNLGLDHKALEFTHFSRIRDGSSASRRNDSPMAPEWMSEKFQDFKI